MPAFVAAVHHRADAASRAMSRTSAQAKSRWTTSPASAEQLVELARFVDQVNPDVLQQPMSMLA
jgi:hypothetical protein